MNRPSLSIGIEEEYQTIDPQTRDLRSHIQSEILSKAKVALHEAVKPEMHQSVVEVGTKVCRDIKEARANILDLRRKMITLASVIILRRKSRMLARASLMSRQTLVPTSTTDWCISGLTASCR